MTNLAKNTIISKTEAGHVFDTFGDMVDNSQLAEGPIRGFLTMKDVK
jgi:hypothetical protein